MVYRYSSRLARLDEGFLNPKLKNARSYDRIAGYFCSSILEVAGENIEAVTGKVRIICNSNLNKEDVDIAIKAQQMKQEWCEFHPEEKYTSPAAKDRLSRLFRLLVSDKLEVRVIPDEVYGLMHGKAGVITYQDGSKTSFLGSINETKSAFSLNYELVWEDNSPEAVKWVQDEFDYFWNNKYAVNLCDFVIKDINRISRRHVVPLQEWKERDHADVPEVAAETPVFRNEFGLWEHQKYFVERAFQEHMKPGGARLLLADQVGLGKTVQLAMAAKLMALYGDKPILIIVPKTLVFQWQEEMMSLLDMPSAVWTGRGWQDETGYFYQGTGAKSILKCPRRVGIISQGLVARRTEASEYLKQQTYECVIVDECHRARRRNPSKDPDTHHADPNFLLRFLNEITYKTKSMLLATATPVQINTIEVYDLLNALALPTTKVMGDMYSKWRSIPQTMLDIVCGDKGAPNEESAMWDIMRDPFPERSKDSVVINSVRDALDVPDDKFVLGPEVYSDSRPSIKEKIRSLYTAGDFVHNYNPYLRCIIRRTRDYLENTLNPDTGEPYLKKIEVKLYGEEDSEALPLQGYLRQAYELAQQLCEMISKRVRGGGFLSTLILKRIGSTICAGESTAKKMLAWTDEGRRILEDEFDTNFEDDDYDSLDSDSDVKDLTPEEIEVLRNLVKVLSLNRDNDPKCGRALEILTHGADEQDTPWMQAGCILFSQYYDSAHYLAEYLSSQLPGKIIGLYAGGDKSGIFSDGQFEKKDKEFIKNSVKTHEIRILVGTDAASEGLNLQTLSTLINLDLPWNPTRLEQRKGRIQRIGQVSNTVRIYNMRYKDSVEDKVHKVLSGRLNDIYNMFGQIPDTLEDVWIDIATNNEEKARERIDMVPNKNPFKLKYEERPGKTEDWASCEAVLDKADVKKALLKGWSCKE